MSANYHLFEVFGIELEYMLVDTTTMNVSPKVAELLTAKNGVLIDDIENGAIGWSNELVAHVVEIKTNGPTDELNSLAETFHQNICEINNLLKSLNSKLLGTACHPLMNPFEETKLWQHGSNEIYELYNQIFDCKGHGWSNLQSMHINLPFYDDEEFEKLHAAIRIVLPILPGLCASSPILDGKITGFKDSRLEQYKTNQKEIPVIAGKVIPEQVFSKEAYEKGIYTPIQKAIEPFNEDGILDYHFVNSRGAIARFDRDAIEIRVIDIQECPKADIAIAVFVIEVLKLLVSNLFTDLNSQKDWHQNELSYILDSCIKYGENYEITNFGYLEELGLGDHCLVQDVWKHLYEQTKNNIAPHYREAIEIILNKGTLSTRIETALQHDFSEENIKKVYLNLGECLTQNILFDI
ncbi:glutamate-cysteine ligase family protein [Wenyingzhuangia sp. 2_MG-2023]|uniref:glutamate-cysteine ligase family protein n=1 Tax=Wenyingzhuangia sp. 2_MG-2023 TaxID=3062639 RepID=UPI0026E2951B|nr:glutamate-cysteine ligase family protein [Wenyingzhuangia sp. 2_MG-2023]MDO6737838.1 glutamate-cysteine ligase family protein [Wenyingzhuangia sp. 2_MG-2023]